MMEMLPAGPLWTVMLPERVRTSRSAAPLTESFRSNRPCSEADARVVTSRRLKATRNVFTTGRMDTLLFENLFIAQGLHRSHVRSSLRRIHPGGQSDH